MNSSVAIVGAGPAGMAVAAMLRERGVPHRIFDRAGVAGGAYREIYERVMLSSPRALNALPGLPLPGDTYVSVAEYRRYLDEYATHHKITVEKANVERIASGFELTIDGKTVAAKFVVVATGMWSHPSAPSLPVSFMHSQKWRGAAAHPEEKILVVGGGASAVEIAEEIAKSGRTCWVSSRSAIRLAPQRVLGRDVHDWIGPIERLPTWLARRWCATHPTKPPTDLGFSSLRAQGKIRVVGGVVAAEAGELRFSDGARERFDLVVAATGFHFATPFLPGEVARASGGHIVARDNESVSWRNLFVVGAPCARGLKSEFLRGIAEDAEAVAREISDRSTS